MARDEQIRSLRKVNPLGRLFYAQLVIQSWMCFAKSRTPEVQKLVLKRERVKRFKLPPPDSHQAQARWSPIPDMEEYQDWPKILL